MIEADFYIEPATWTVDREAIREIRSLVFIDEQGISEADEFDNEDAQASHFLARSQTGQAVGTARLGSDGKIGRIAVLAQWRGRGVGSALLRSAIERAMERAMTMVYLDAQTHALPFYRHHQFLAEGEVFQDAGIAHQRMQRAIQPSRAPTPQRARRQAQQDESKTELEFGQLGEWQAALLRLLQRCQRELSILTHNLEHRVMDQAEVIEEIRQIATFGPRADIRILVIDSRAAVQQGHGLIHLAQRLPSTICIRRPDKMHRDYPSAFVIADQRHWIFRPFGSQAAGELKFNHRHRGRELHRLFIDMWEQAETDPNLRRLDL